MIRKCDDGCSNKYGSQGSNFQDSKYGKGNRVMVECQNGFRCTVCNTTHSVSVVGKKKK